MENVGENQTTGNPALDAFAQAGYTINDQSLETTNDNTPESESQSTQSETQTNVDESSQVESKTNDSENSFDENAFFEEISGGAYKTRDDLQNALRRADKFDELRNAYDELSNQPNEPEYASDLVKELNSFVSNGGDPNTFFKLVSANYDEMSDIDVLAQKMVTNNSTISMQEAKEYLVEKYRQNDEEYSEKEVKLGKIDLGMEANKARSEFSQLKQNALKENKNFISNEEWSENNLNQWNEPLTDEVFSVEKISIDLPDNLGTFEYNISEEDRDSLDDDIYDLIADTGMEYNQENLGKIRQIAADTFFLKNKDKIINSAISSAISKIKEGNYKESHNPSAIPDERVPNRDKELSREEAAATLIARNW
jgi:hypothetical protein